MPNQSRSRSIAARHTSVNTARPAVAPYRLALSLSVASDVSRGGQTAALLARYAAHPNGSPAVFANALVDAIEDDPQVLHDVLLATANRRDSNVRMRRRELVSLLGHALARCYAELIAADDGHAILAAEQRRQELGLALAADARTPEIERAIVRVSDTIAQAKDPCYRTAKRQRQTGLFRRAEDGLPLFQPVRPLGRSGAYYGDVDVLTWCWLNLVVLTLEDADGEQYEETAPLPDDHGDIPFETFCIWERRSRADRFKKGERRIFRNGARVAREDEAVCGLHENGAGALVVNLPKFLLDRIARRTGRWSRVAREAQQDRAAECAPAAALLVTECPVRTEKFLLRLAAEGADVSYLAQLWKDQIEEERRLGIYA